MRAYVPQTSPVTAACCVRQSSMDYPKTQAETLSRPSGNEVANSFGIGSKALKLRLYQQLADRQSALRPLNLILAK